MCLFFLFCHKPQQCQKKPKAATEAWVVNLGSALCCAATPSHVSPLTLDTLLLLQSYQRGWYAKYNGETSKSTWEVLNNGCCTAEKKHSALKINTFECIINANFSLMLHSILYFFPHCLTVFFFFFSLKQVNLQCG